MPLRSTCDAASLLSPATATPVAPLESQGFPKQLIKFLRHITLDGAYFPPKCDTHADLAVTWRSMLARHANNAAGLVVSPQVLVRV